MFIGFGSAMSSLRSASHSNTVAYMRMSKRKGTSASTHYNNDSQEDSYNQRETMSLEEHKAEITKINNVMDPIAKQLIVFLTIVLAIMLFIGFIAFTSSK